MKDLRERCEQLFSEGRITLLGIDSVEQLAREIVTPYVKALHAVQQDAIKCEQSDSPVQYVVTEWAMQKCRDALALAIDVSDQKQVDKD